MSSQASGPSRYDVVVVGGGHNGLTAAAYLARAGLSVVVLERLPHVGGAAVSTVAFRGLPTRLSRWSYLVSLMPERLMAELDLGLRLASRAVSSYTPVEREGRSTGLLVERPEGRATAESFRRLTGSDADHAAWRAFYAEVSRLAEVVAPTLMEPLPRERELSDQVAPTTWHDLVEAPLGEAIERRFVDDTVRGVVATDALIGTFASMHDASLAQNRCFLYHLIGNGTGEWRVPVGGMGAVTESLGRAAAQAGAQLVTGAEVLAVRADDAGAVVRWRAADGVRETPARFVLSNVAPWTLEGLLGHERDQRDKPVGSQVKVNFVLQRLPRLRSGIDPRIAFGGTLHLGEDYSSLETAHAEAAAGRLPRQMPGEAYCHTLTDPSILGAVPAGTHTLTYFGLHAPATLFEVGTAQVRTNALRHAIDSINAHLAEPIESVVARDAAGNLCIEVKIPQDVEAELAMPGGHIFHGDLEWPWATQRAALDTPASRWGVQTGVEAVLMCGAGARRGGAVSGLGGHNAAMAVLESR